MAYTLIRATLGQSLGNGAYNSVAATLGDKVAALDTTITAATDASAATTADGTVAGDPTALGLSQATDAALVTVAAAQTVMKAGDINVSINMAVITDRPKFRAAMRAIEAAAFGSVV